MGEPDWFIKLCKRQVTVTISGNYWATVLATVALIDLAGKVHALNMYQMLRECMS